MHSSDNELEDNEQVIQEPSPVVVQNPDKGNNDDAICESKEDSTLSELPKELPKEEAISDSDGDDKPLFPPVPSLPVPLTKRAQRVQKRQQQSGEPHDSLESHESRESHELPVEPSLEESRDNHDMSAHSSLQEPKEPSPVDDSEFDWDDDSIWNASSSSDQSPVLPPPLPNQPKPQLVKEDVSELPQELERKKWNVKHEREWSDDWNERPAQELAKKERLKERKEESIEEEWSDDWDEPPKQEVKKEPMQRKKEEWSDWDEPPKQEVKKEPIQRKKEEWSDDWDEPPKQSIVKKEPIQRKKESIEEEWSDWDEPPSQQETSQSSYRIPDPRKPIQPSLQKDDWSDEDLPVEKRHIQIESKDWPDEPVQPRNPPHSPELIKSGLSSQFFNRKDTLHDSWSEEDLPVERISEKEEWSDWEDLPTEPSNPVVIQKPSRSAKRGSQGGVFDDLFESPKKDTKQRITEFLCTIPDLSFLADPLINIHYG